MDSPSETTLDIALVAWPNHSARLKAFIDTVHALQVFLITTGLRVSWLCSSESAVDPKHPRGGDQLWEFCAHNNIRLEFRKGAPGLGENMNAALRMCDSEFILLVQDDRPPFRSLDLSHGVSYLRKHPDVALIRYDWPRGRNADTGIERTPRDPVGNGWHRLCCEGPWFYGDEPQLRHRSFMDRYGWYKEGVQHGKSETDMKIRLRYARATIITPQYPYFSHNCGGVSAVLNDVRPQGAHR